MGKKEHRETQASSPSRAARIRSGLVLLLGLAGLFLSIYLSILHVALLNGIAGGSPLCGAGHGLGCHAVTASPYADFLGLPVSVWGVVYFATIVLLGLGGGIFRGARSRPFLLWAFTLVCAGLVFDVYLGFVMFFRIRVLCPLCATTYLVNILLFVVLVGALKAPAEATEPLRSVLPRLRVPAGEGDASYYQNAVRGFLLGINILVIVAVLTLYGMFSSQGAADGEAQLENIQQVFSRTQPRRVTSQGYPEMGSPEAAMTVVEFSDFRCPFCRRAAEMVKIVAANNRDRARFVFRHFPLDTACNTRIQRSLHPGACLLAAGSVCAHEQGKFWEFHDEAFQAEGRIDGEVLEGIATTIGLDLDLFRACMNSSHPGNVVQRDIQEASALGVTSTPTFFFNGLPLAGAPRNPWVFEQLILHPEAQQKAAAGSH